MNKFLTNLGQTFSDDEKAVIKNKLENILGTDQVKMAWYPTVANNGTISWGLSAYSTSTPTPMNIKGPQGEAGKDGDDGEPGTSVTIENIETITGGRKVIFSDGNEITIYDGKDGAGVAIKGTVDDVADLPSTAENGDAYIVNNDDGKLYVYANGWPTSGVAFTGPKGADGDTPTLAFIENSEKTGIDIFVNGGEEPVNTIPYATDGHSPVITTSATSTGNDIYIDGTKAFSVTNGINGTSGKDGYTPSATTATVTDEGHPNSGTKVTLSWPADASWLSPVSFTAWNGNDGITPDNVVTSGTAQAEEKPWVLSAGQWVNATNLVSMYKTSNTANIKPVTQVLYNYHTYDEDRYNYIEVTDSSNKVWSAHTLIHPMYDSIKFAENGLLTGTCESGVWTLSAKTQGGEGGSYLFDSTTLSGDGTEGNEIGVDTEALAGMYLPLTGGTVDVSTGDGRLRYIMSNNYDATSFVIQRGNNEITFGVAEAGGCVMKAASLNSQLVVNDVGVQYTKTNGSEGSYYAAMSLNESPIKIVTTAELPETTDDNTLYFVLE